MHHEEAPAEAAAHRADEDDETAMEVAEGVPTLLLSRDFESREHIDWRTRRTELGVRQACDDEDAKLITKDRHSKR